MPLGDLEGLSGLLTHGDPGDFTLTPTFGGIRVWWGFRDICRLGLQQDEYREGSRNLSVDCLDIEEVQSGPRVWHAENIGRKLRATDRMTVARTRRLLDGLNPVEQVLASVTGVFAEVVPGPLGDLVLLRFGESSERCHPLG